MSAPISSKLRKMADYAFAVHELKRSVLSKIGVQGVFIMTPRIAAPE